MAGGDDIKAFAKLETTVQHLVDQVNRLVSHVKSEQRVTGNISKRVDLLQYAVARLEKTIDEIKKELAKNEDESKKDKKWNATQLIMILSLIVNAVLGYLMIIK